MITIEQLLESVDLDFEPRFITKSKTGHISIWRGKPGESIFIVFGKLRISEFENKDWTECIYEVPRKATGKIEKVEVGYKDSFKIKDWQDVARTVENKINEIVDYVNALIESNNIHEKQIDKLQMKLEPEKCAVNELKGANNE